MTRARILLPRLATSSPARHLLLALPLLAGAACESRPTAVTDPRPVAPAERPPTPSLHAIDGLSGPVSVGPNGDSPALVADGPAHSRPATPATATTASSVRESSLATSTQFYLLTQPKGAGNLQYYVARNGSLVNSGTIASLFGNLRLVGSANFTGDGSPDLVVEDTQSGDRWLLEMKFLTAVQWIPLGNIATSWHIVAAADLDGDGQPEIVCENNVSGERGYWKVRGNKLSEWVSWGVLDRELHIVGAGAADFTQDGTPDILLEQTRTGDRWMWRMRGATPIEWIYIGRVSTELHISAIAELSGDNQPDVVLANTRTGEKWYWRMAGPVPVSWGSLPLGAGEDVLGSLALQSAPANPTVRGLLGCYQFARDGIPVAVPPRGRVLDVFSAPVTGAAVTFTGPGAITGGQTVTDANGEAAVGSWTPPPGGGQLRMHVAGSDPTSDFVFDSGHDAFTITPRFLPSVSSRTMLAFTRAAARWQPIRNGLRDARVTVTYDPAADPITADADDIFIVVTVRPIDGVGGLMAQTTPPTTAATPTCRDAFGAAITIDAADVQALEQSSAIDQVMAREIGHALGVGTSQSLWTSLIQNGPFAPRFSGTAATAQFTALGGSGMPPLSVALNGADSHWLSSRFGYELMSDAPTSWSDGKTRTLSRITLGALSDMGWDIDFTKGEAYALPGPSLIIVSVSGSGAGHVSESAGVGIDCPGSCVENLLLPSVVLDADTLDASSHFQQWRGFCAAETTRHCTVAAGAPRTVEAVFTTVTYPLTMTITAGNGSISGTPAGGCTSALNVAVTCTEAIKRGTTLGLFASPAAGYAFDGWGGACSGQLSCDISMTQGMAVTAHFTARLGRQVAPQGFAPKGMVLVGTTLYGADGSSIKKVDVSGGPVSTVVSGIAFGGRVATDGTSLFWTEGQGFFGTGRIRSVPLVRLLPADTIRDIAKNLWNLQENSLIVNQGYVFFVASPGANTTVYGIWRVSATNLGDSQSSNSNPGFIRIFDIADGWLYSTHAGKEITKSRPDFANGGTFATYEAVPFETIGQQPMRAVGGQLFFLNRDGALLSVPVTGGTVTQRILRVNCPVSNLSSDGTYLYFNDCDGLERLNPSTFNRTLIDRHFVSSLDFILLDAMNVYWAEYFGTVRTLPKPP